MSTTHQAVWGHWRDEFLRAAARAAEASAADQQLPPVLYGSAGRAACSRCGPAVREWCLEVSAGGDVTFLLVCGVCGGQLQILDGQAVVALLNLMLRQPEAT